MVKGLFLILALPLGFTSGISSARAQESLWETPSVWQSEQEGKKEKPSGSNAHRPGQNTADKIKQKCEEQLYRAEVREVSRGGGTVSRYRELSPYEKIEKDCKGQVGEGFCKSERAAESLDSCMKAEQVKEELAKKGPPGGERR